MKNRSAILWALGRVRKRIPALLLLTLSHIFSALLGVMFALGTRQVIDTAVAGDRDAFYRACLIQGCIILGSLLSLTLTRHLREHMTHLLNRDWKRDLLSVLLHGDYTAVSGYHSAELINRMNNDVRTLDDGLLGIVPSLCSMLTKLIAAFLVLLNLEPVFTLLLMAAGVAVVVATALMRRRLKGMHKQVSEANGKVSGFFQETLEKLLMVQAMDVSAEMERRSDQLLEDRFRIQRKRKNISLFANTSISIMSYAASFISLVWCAFGLLRGQLTFGSLTAVTQLVSQLQNPFVSLSAIIPQYIAASAAAERILELAELEQEPAPAAEDPQALYRRMDAICAEHLTFSYDRDNILQDAAFRLPKGSFSVITGPSGIGKSTLLKLLLGIFRPESGMLYTECGQQRYPLDRSSRRLFAYVPQGNLLLSGTLRDNLTIVRPDATEDEIAQAIYASAMDEYLPSLPMGLDTVIGESAAGLSEGQAQRLAIARAILGGAPVLLLDESTSALDAQTEETVLQRIRALPDRTCIAVTHRPAAIALCDWNLEMDGKSILMKKISHSAK